MKVKYLGGYPSIQAAGQTFERNVAQTVDDALGQKLTKDSTLFVNVDAPAVAEEAAETPVSEVETPSTLTETTPSAKKARK